MQFLKLFVLIHLEKKPNFSHVSPVIKSMAVISHVLNVC